MQKSAQEVAQEALIMVWRKAASFDRTRASAATWLYTIARNKRIDFLRRNNRPAIDTEDWLTVFAPEDDDADKSVLAGQTYTRVKELLSGLFGRSTGRDRKGVLRGQDATRSSPRS